MEIPPFYAPTEEDYNTAIEDENGLLYSYDGKMLLHATNPELTEYHIKQGTEIICDGAFFIPGDNNENITLIERIYLPDSIKVIDREAFMDCANLVYINIPLGLDTIIPGAFCGCYNVQLMWFCLIHCGLYVLRCFTVAMLLPKLFCQKTLKKSANLPLLTTNCLKLNCLQHRA